MRLMRNLPIMGKLILSAVLTLSLLGALIFMVMSALGTLRTTDSANDAAIEQRQVLNDVNLKVREIRLVTRDMMEAQSGGAVDQAAGRARVRVAETQQLLETVKSAAADADEARLADAAIASLANYAGTLDRVSTMRAGLIRMRDQDLLAAPVRLEVAIMPVRNGVTGDDVPPAVAAAASGLLGGFMSSTDQVNALSLRFLATGNPSLRQQVEDGSASAIAKLDALAHLPLPDGIAPGIAPGIAGLRKASESLSHAALGLFDAQAAMNDYVERDSEGAYRKLTDLVSIAARGAADRAATAKQAAAAAADFARQSLLAISGGVAVLMVAAALLIGRMISRPIRHLTDAVSAIARGEKVAAIGMTGRRDEIGQMASALERLRAEVEQAFVHRQMIEQVPVGLMTADYAQDMRITYANPAAIEVMQVIAAHLPVPPDEIVGQTIDVVHRDPGAIRTALSDPARLPLRTRMRIGDEVIQIEASTVRDREGAASGVMVSWRLRTDQARLIEQFERSVGAMSRQLGDTAEAMTATASAMHEAADESGRRAVAVASASGEAGGSVQAVAASAEELAASVAEISRQVSESAHIARQAVAEAEATDRSVTGLSEAATRIGDVVQLIGDIAGRTNLLALNATIEAARAGDAGKGFAVVASEVKTLATQTARATEEIAAQIAAMQGATGQAVTTLRGIGATIQRMSEIATAIAGAVEQQGAATREIARAVQQASLGTTEVTDNIARVSEAVEQTGGQAARVLTEARTLKEQSSTLKSDVDSFLSAVQQAA